MCNYAMNDICSIRLIGVVVQSLDRLGRQGHTMDDSAEVLFQSFRQEATVNRFNMGRCPLLDVVNLEGATGSMECLLLCQGDEWKYR